VTTYVAYRSNDPDQETRNEVNRELQDHAVDLTKLENWSTEYCPPEETGPPAEAAAPAATAPPAATAAPAEAASGSSA
jgi:hypothetical protein